MGRSRSRSRSRSPRGRRRPSRSMSRSRSRSSSIEDGHRVHVADLGNVSQIGIDSSKREIERAFEKFGPVLEVWLARNPPCFAFVVFRHKEDADESIAEMNGKTLCGSRVRCSYALPRSRGRRARRGYDPNLRCYTCGERGHFSRDCDNYGRRIGGYGRRYTSRSPSPYRRRGGRFSRSRSRSPRRGADKRRSRSRSPRKSRSRSGSRPRRTRTDSKRSRSRSIDRSRDRGQDVVLNQSNGRQSVSRSRSRSP